MKLKKVNKVLSITLASAMLVSSVPVNTFADEAESELATEQAEKKEEKAEKAAVKAESSNPAEEGSKEAKAASAGDAENTNKGDTSGSGEANGGNTNNETPTGSGEANSGNTNNETPTGSGEANGGNTNNETPTGSGEANGGNRNNETPTGSGEANGGNTNNETPAGSGEANGGNTNNETPTGSGEANGGNANNGSSSGSGNENSNDANNNNSADNGNSGESGNGNAEDGNNNSKPGEDDKKDEDNKNTEVKYSVRWDYTKPYSYTGKAQVPKPKVTGIDEDQYDLKVYRVVDGAEIKKEDCKDAGDYIAKVVIKEDSDTNYTLSEGSAEQKFTIEKRKIDKFDEFETQLPYTGAVQAPVVTCKDVNGAEIQCEVEPDKDAINVRENAYKAKASLPDAYKTNYTLVDGNGKEVDAKTIEYNIKKAKLEITWSDTQNLTYKKGTAQVPTAQVVNTANRKKVDAKVETSGACVDAGDYSAEVVINEGAGNYNMPENTKITFTIGKADIEVSWNSKEFCYDGAKHVPQPKLAPAVEENYTVKKKNSDGIWADIQEEDCKAAGNYEICLELSEADKNEDGSYKNYNLINDTTEFEITKATAVIKWGTTKFIYTAGAQVPSLEITGVDGRELKKEVTYYAADKDGKPVGEPINSTDCINVGNYVAKVALVEEDANNYNLDETAVSVGFEITKATAAIEWGETEFTYDGEDQKPTLEVKDSTGNSIAETEYTVSVLKGKEEDTSEDKPEEALSAGSYTNAGDYHVLVTVSSNYKFDDQGSRSQTKDFNIAKRKVQLTLTAESKVKTYGTIDPEFSYTAPAELVQDGENGFNLTEDFADAFKSAGAKFYRASENAGEDVIKDGYEISFDPGNGFANYEVAYNPEHLVINPLAITVTPVSGQYIYYGENDPDYAYSVTIDSKEFNEGSKRDKFAENPEETVKQELGSAILDREDKTCKNAKTYKYTIGTNNNYTITLAENEGFEIKPLEIVITPENGQSKYYGENDLNYYKYGVTIKWPEGYTHNPLWIDTDDIKAELDGEKEGTPTIKVLEREKGEDADFYAYEYAGENKNYTASIEKEAPKFEIKALPITITPKGETKLYGEKEPEFYAYDVTIGNETISETDFKANMRKDFLTKWKAKTAEEAVANELGTTILERAKGENPNEYAYSYITEGANTNYAVAKIADTAPKFVIQNLTIDVPKSIGSRQTSFTVETTLTDKKRSESAEQVSTGNLADVQTKVVVTDVVLPTETDGITFPTDMDAYISESSTGILFNGQNPKVSVNTVDYAKGEQSWVGKLPAGTTFKVQVVNAEGKPVSDAKEITVTKKNVSLGNWGTYLGTSADGRNFIKNDVALTNELDSDTEELVEVTYKSNAKSDKATETVYKFSKKGESFSYQPKVSNEANAHVTQSLTASIVDTLNLTCESKSDTFYVDNEAFQASTVEFKNRATEMTITLPEYGTIDSVEIAGATVTVGGEKAKEFTLPVKWSGKELVQSGSGIQVRYTDEAGNKGTGTGTVARSSVSTPIRFKIKPELNGAGYLNGRSSTLLISGTACACEQIRISVAGSTQTTYATQKETWSDENGSWEVAVSMDSLPEGDDFEISAEYVDVDGAGYTMTAKYNAYCADTAVLSPIYEAMTCLSGMVEPQTTIALVLNGESQEFYEIEVDRFGHFVLDDVPMMFAGESFDIYVTDIAGNQSISHYEIPELEDPFEIKSTVNPLGKFFYFGERSGSEAYLATPVSAADFTEEKDHIELPLLMGGSYEVGTMTLQKTENGFTVSSELQVSENIDPEDYSVENEKLYVYTSRPTMDDLRNRTGQEYAYGEEIPFGENETVWIVDQKDMTILADSVMDLDVFKFGESEEYEAYQER